MKTTATKRHLVTEALALHLGYKVDGKTGLVDGVDIRNALAEVAINDIAPTRRVGLGAAAGVAGVASFGLLAAPLALLGLKKKTRSRWPRSSSTRRPTRSILGTTHEACPRATAGPASSSRTPQARPA